MLRCPNAFYFMKCAKTDATDDNEEYRVNLVKCNLYVCVGQMTEVIYKSLISRFKKEPLFHHYRKTICKSYAIATESSVFSTQNLFPENESPLKIHFVVVETKLLTGDYTK